MKLKRWLAVLVMMVLLLQGLSGTAMAVTLEKMEGQLLCTCGCAKPSLETCTCEVSDTMRTDIREQIDGGKNESQIIDFMKSKYGQTVVNAPSKSGFDLTAWLMPFAVVFAGSVGVVKVMSTWIKKGKDNDGDDHVDDDNNDNDGPGADDRVESELKDFGW